MAGLKLKDFRVLTFDVYGTLINWEDNMLVPLEPFLAANKLTVTPENRDHILSTLSRVENAQQSKTPDMPYPEVLSTSLPEFAKALNLSVPPTAEQCAAFGASVGSWPAFPDTVDALRQLQKHFKLVVLSNVDRESFAATNKGPLEGLPFDLVLTAQDIGSYKPDPRNFEYMLREVEAKFGVGKEGVIQTAHSLFHDHVPAQRIGMRSCWISRPGSAILSKPGEEVRYDWEFETLGDMADALEDELASG